MLKISLDFLKMFNSSILFVAILLLQLSTAMPYVDQYTQGTIIQNLAMGGSLGQDKYMMAMSGYYMGDTMQNNYGGYGSRYGNTYGHGYNKGYGSGYGHGYGSSYGRGYGSGYGSSYSRGYGSGYGSSYGRGYGSSYSPYYYSQYGYLGR